MLKFRILRIIYFALAESILNCGLVAWENAGSTTLSKLQVFQKWIIKIMFVKKNLYPTDFVIY